MNLPPLRRFSLFRLGKKAEFQTLCAKDSNKSGKLKDLIYILAKRFLCDRVDIEVQVVGIANAPKKEA